MSVLPSSLDSYNVVKTSLAYDQTINPILSESVTNYCFAYSLFPFVKNYISNSTLSVISSLGNSSVQILQNTLTFNLIDTKYSTINSNTTISLISCMANYDIMISNIEKRSYFANSVFSCKNNLKSVYDIINSILTIIQNQNLTINNLISTSIQSFLSYFLSDVYGTLNDLYSKLIDSNPVPSSYKKIFYQTMVNIYNISDALTVATEVMNVSVINTILLSKSIIETPQEQVVPVISQTIQIKYINRNLKNSSNNLKQKSKDKSRQNNKNSNKTVRVSNE